MRDDPGNALALGGFLVIVIGMLCLIMFQFSGGLEPGNPSRSAPVAKGW